MKCHSSYLLTQTDVFSQWLWSRSGSVLGLLLIRPIRKRRGGGFGSSARRLEVKNAAQIEAKIEGAVPPPATGLGEKCSFEHSLRICDVQLEDMPSSLNIHAK